MDTDRKESSMGCSACTLVKEEDYYYTHECEHRYCIECFSFLCLRGRIVVCLICNTETIAQEWKNSCWKVKLHCQYMQSLQEYYRKESEEGEKLKLFLHEKQRRANEELKNSPSKSSKKLDEVVYVDS